MTEHTCDDSCSLGHVSLSEFEWHDLSVEEVMFSSKGLKLTLCPFNESSKEYESYRLELDGELDYCMENSFSSTSLNCLEITTLDYRESKNGKISGVLGFLPGDDGYWEIRFNNVAWLLTKLSF
ncbi:hypothetical protein GCM10007938_36310 [Vibrio zhanjiangensis]|uniref:Uncharacterized protein n=1 Tax=Vibrio zhanjiangensis TaxID=1046128 RepID=A0ABQ6F2X8_9VIBR|nr:hypothetical protein [Vibrio zhanjiangensis]GLT19848.1 hypothetical protein GCM10007938_36310 [Vibrio zhanjiangensis]